MALGWTRAGCRRVVDGMVWTNGTEGAHVFSTLARLHPGRGRTLSVEMWDFPLDAGLASLRDVVCPVSTALVDFRTRQQLSEKLALRHPASARASRIPLDCIARLLDRDTGDFRDRGAVA